MRENYSGVSRRCLLRSVGRHISLDKETAIANLHLSLLNRMGVESQQFNTSICKLADLG